MKYIILIIILALIGSVNAQCGCVNCTDCENKLNNVLCSEVNLTTNIINHSGVCINDPINFENKTFNCQNYLIDGDDTGTDYGIYLSSKDNNTIKNCLITDFRFGIYLIISNDNFLYNNTLNSNFNYGLLLDSSLQNNLTNNSINSNGLYGIWLSSSSSNNILINNSITNNEILLISLLYIR